jgi:tRNA pseudouridine13 synthase
VGNAFRIVVRNLEPSFARYASERRKVHGYTLNYYWTQRFGVPDGPKRTHIVGRALLDRDWDTALACLAELRSPESVSAQRWAGRAEDFFLRADPRLTSFYLAAHSSHLWNALVRKTAEHVFAEPGTVLELEGIEFLLPSNTQDAIRLMTHADMLPYTRYSFTAEGIEQHESVRSTVQQTVISVTDCRPDEVHVGQSAITLDLFLPAGSYATSTVQQVLMYGMPYPGNV